MKRSIVAAGLAMAGAVAWIGFREANLEAKLKGLEAEKQGLVNELSNQAAAPLAEMRNAQSRLADTELALTLAEERLSKLNAHLNEAQRRLQPIRQDSAPVETVDVLTSPAPRLPASSHTPSGELLHRNWGPEQVVGPPDTTTAGDIPTAWAARDPNGGEEWLKLDYERATDLAEVRVRETLHPGAISKLTAVLPSGEEVTIWEGQEPQSEAPVDTSFPVISGVRASSVKIYLDSRRVPGWNEIDAVELVGQDGSRQWAKSALASSTYAEQ